MSSVAIFKALTAKQGLGKMSGSLSLTNAKGFVMLFERIAGKSKKNYKENKQFCIYNQLL